MPYRGNDSFLINRLKSVMYAFRGMLILIRTEASIQIQIGVVILVTCTGILFNISSVEWMMQIGMIGLIMSVEGLNTAIEYIADFVHPEHHKKIGLIKDIAAGAVFIAAITSILVGCIIYIPKII